MKIWAGLSIIWAWLSIIWAGLRLIFTCMVTYTMFIVV